MIIKNLSKSFDAKTVLDEVSFTIRSGEKIGLIGNNGEGKSTLMKILTNSLSADKGSIDYEDNKIGLLKQEFEIKYYEYTILDYIKLSLGLKELEDEIKSLENKLDDEECFAKYSKVLDRFLSLDGYNLEDNLSVILKNLEFKDSLYKKIGELSGGEKIKVFLSELLLSDADILLLDEPTNNLDYKAIDFLNKFLRESNKGMLIVSHNQDFLENLVDVIFELKDGRITRYSMKLSEYFREKDLEYQRGYDEYLSNMDRRDEIKETLQNLHRINDKHANVKPKDGNKLSFYNKKSQAEQKGASKIKRLEKELDSLDVSFREKEKINYKFNFDSSRGKKDINLIELSCGYETFKTKELTLVIPFGSRVNIKGVNGSGKTTLIKTILGELEPQCGTLEVGSDIKFGYISQDSLIKATDETVYKYLTRDIDKPDEGAIFTILDKFHIPYEEKDKSFKVLSPGERTRVNLAALAINKINVLILDEATNHLDFEAQELLIETLDNFTGTILNISHNRSFNEKLKPNLEINLDK